MSGGVDFWRPPMAELPDSDDEGPAPAVKAESFAPPPRTLQEAPEKRRNWQLEIEPAWSTQAVGKPGVVSSIDVDEAAVKGAAFPVKLASLSKYLRALRVVEKSEAGKTASPDGMAAQVAAVKPVAAKDLPGVWAAGKLAEAFSPDALPKELLGAGIGTRSSLQLGGHEELLWNCSERESWRSLFDGALQGPNQAICGKISPVPPLPNPFTVSTDCPALVEQMLKDIPPEEWESKRFLDPVPIDGLPGLCHGPGGLLASQTPKQLAQNQLAAAVLNRLCGNLLITLARACRDHALERRVPPEEQAVAAAKLALSRADKALQAAKAEETIAESELKTFRASYMLDAERQRHLEAVTGWKSSARAQSEVELEEARKALRDADAARAASVFAGAKPPSWNQRWQSLVPQEVASEEIFVVKLAETGQVCCTLSEFFSAMQQGMIDRARGGYVPKHALEVAFVRHAADNLLLCSSEKGDFTHLPAPVSTSSGIMDPATSSELRAVRPHHSIVIRLEGQSFPFSVSFQSMSPRPLGFYGLGAHALTYSTPWNPVEYADVLWAREAQDSLTLMPLVAVLSALVSDPDLPIGPLAPVPASQASLSSLPGASAGLAVLQAALFNDVKMWPVMMPHQTRSRWDYALRSLKVVLSIRRNEDEDKNKMPRLPGVDELRDEALSRCTEALPRVPDDGDGSGGMPVTGGAFANHSGGLEDRLKRMELSELRSVPLQGSKALQKALEELLRLWPEFSEESS